MIYSSSIVYQDLIMGGRSNRLPVISDPLSNRLYYLFCKNGSALSRLTFAYTKKLYAMMFSACSREDILDIERRVENMPTVYDEIPYELFHSFADGMYRREVHIPAGEIVVGKIHRNDYFVELIKGSMWVSSEFYCKEITAPASFKAPSGVKHVVYTLEDSVWVDTHNISSDNIKDAEKEIFVSSYEDLDKHNGVLSEEYLSMCDDIGLTPKKAREISIQSSDVTEMEEKYIDNVEVKSSGIEGRGVFALKSFLKGDILGQARVDGKRATLGRYVNHSDDANVYCKPIKNNTEIIVIAKNNIDKNEEIVMDYRQTRKIATQIDGVS